MSNGVGVELCSYSLSHKWGIIADYTGTTHPDAAWNSNNVTLLVSLTSSTQHILLWHIVTILVAAGVFKLLEVIASYLSTRSPHYCKLPAHKQVTWSNKCVSTVHALFTGTAALYVVLVDDCDRTMWNNPVYLVSSLHEFVLCVSMGYFAWDILESLYHKPKQWVEMLIHHVVALVSFYCAVAYHRATYWGVLLLMMEVTTPLLNLRWFMAKTGRKGNQLYMLNGWLISFGFLFFRLGVSFLVLWQFYLLWDIIATGEYFLILAFYVEMSALLLLNLFFFYSIVSVGLKTLARSAELREKLKKL